MVETRVNEAEQLNEEPTGNTTNPSPPNNLKGEARFDWAEDAETLPTTSQPAKTYEPHDFSCLRSDQAAPFRTLQRRIRRHRTPHHRRQNWPRCFNTPEIQPFASSTTFTRRHPSGIAHGKQILTIPFGATPAQAPVLKLNWDQDPRLADLSCALRALGWIPPC